MSQIKQYTVSGGLRFGGPCAKYLGALSYKHAKIIRSLPCENVVTAACFVFLSILTGASVKM